MTMRRYLVLGILCSLLLLLAIAVFNVLANPYGYFPVPTWEGFNAKTLGFNHRLRLAKALAIDKVRPTTVIIGNSRAEAGYDPAHPGFSERPAYNLAMGGAGIGEARRYLLETLATGRVRHIVIALDFTMFDAGLWNQGSRADNALLTDEEGNPSDATKAWRRLATVLLAGDTLSDSWWSITHQRRLVALYLPSGLRDDAADLDQVRREGGHRQASLNAEAAFLSSTLKDVQSSAFRQGYRETLDQLRAIAVLARERNIRLTLLINPIHARHTYLFETAGLWPAYERWKRDVAELTREGAELWDFSAVGTCTAEPLPAPDDAATAMRWYREIAHFRRALGDEVLNRVLLGLPSKACGDFGHPLIGGNLDRIFFDQRQALAAWVASHPLDVAEIDGQARRFRRR